MISIRVVLPHSTSASSGNPSWVHREKDKGRYIDGYWYAERIALHKASILKTRDNVL
jgi:hypothetical protein